MSALGFGVLEWKRRKKKKETEEEKEEKVAPFLDPEGKEEKCVVCKGCGSEARRNMSFLRFLFIFQFMEMSIGCCFLFFFPFSVWACVVSCVLMVGRGLRRGRKSGVMSVIVLFN